MTDRDYAWLLGEAPRTIEVAGGAVVLVGVYLALRDARTLDAAPLEVPEV